MILPPAWSSAHAFVDAGGDANYLRRDKILAVVLFTFLFLPCRRVATSPSSNLGIASDMGSPPPRHKILQADMVLTTPRFDCPDLLSDCNRRFSSSEVPIPMASLSSEIRGSSVCF